LKLQIEFENKKLLELYEKGKSRKYPLEARLIKKFFMRIQQLEAAVTIYDLMNTSSLRFERLKSTNDQFSIRLNQEYRLVFRMRFEDKAKTKGKVYIKELSKHYGD
jgi:plasmid maintenance system killer protein